MKPGPLKPVGQHHESREHMEEARAGRRRLRHLGEGIREHALRRLDDLGRPDATDSGGSSASEGAPRPRLPHPPSGPSGSDTGSDLRHPPPAISPRHAPARRKRLGAGGSFRHESPPATMRAEGRAEIRADDRPSGFRQVLRAVWRWVVPKSVMSIYRRPSGAFRLPPVAPTGRLPRPAAGGGGAVPASGSPVPLSRRETGIPSLTEFVRDQVPRQERRPAAAPGGDAGALIVRRARDMVRP